MAKLSTSEARQLCFVFFLLLEGSCWFGIERLRLSFVLAMVSLDEVGASFFSSFPFSMLSLARAFSSTSRDAIRFSTDIFYLLCLRLVANSSRKMATLL
jgi:hypothetical protein